METVKVKTAIDSGKKYNDKPIVNIELEDGRKGAGFDAKFLEYNGKEVELEIKEGKEYNGQKQYIFNLPKEKTAQAAGKFPAKDWTFEKRKAALECAVNVHAGGMVDDNKVLATANNFLTFLNQK